MLAFRPGDLSRVQVISSVGYLQSVKAAVLCKFALLQLIADFPKERIWYYPDKNLNHRYMYQTPDNKTCKLVLQIIFK